MPAATMTSPTTITATARGGEPLDFVLRPIHNAAVAEARRFLEPALEPNVDFWTRWAAVRFICDDFQERYRRERALVDEIRPFLLPEVSERLAREGDGVYRLRRELDRIGRRRATAAEFAAAVRDLLEQLVLWYAEIELAASGITRDVLPKGTDLIGHLEAPLQFSP
jgi:hypothetical protein